jgi:hypothetical protein
LLLLVLLLVGGGGGGGAECGVLFLVFVCYLRGLFLTPTPTTNEKTHT